MTANQSRLMGVALLLAVVLAVMQFARGRDPAGGGAERGADSDAARKRQLEQSQARQKERLERGAYIVRSKELSATETIQTVIIPEGLSEEFDTRCVIYRNAELKTSSITCTGILFRQSLPPS